MPTAVISALIKAGNLTHKTFSESPSTSPTESTCCIPQQAVDSALRTPVPNNGRFLIFYCYTNKSANDHLPSTSDKTFCQHWDQCKGWQYEVTLEGTVKYHGPYRGLETDIVREWMKGMVEIRRLINPREIVSLNESGSIRIATHDEEIGPTSSHREYHSEVDKIPSSTNSDTITYRFALYGCGDHVSIASTISAATGQGTWQRLANEPRKSFKTTHVLYISLPELIGHMIACGVAAQDVTRSLQQGEWGCVKLDFPAMEWKSPASMKSENDTNQGETWEDEWWYTSSPGMEVWVC